MKHAMIDIETLDTGPSSVVLTVGACKFDPHSSEPPTEKRLWRPEVEDQLQQGRTASEETLEWWAKQDQGVRESTFTETGRISVIEFFKDLNKYLVGVDKVWCQGPQFDMVILEDLYKQYQHHCNWAFWQIMDCRTIFNMMPKDPRKAVQKNLHSADDDAYWQAVCVQQCYQAFGVKPR
jgi:hypothetical protein